MGIADFYLKINFKVKNMMNLKQFINHLLGKKYLEFWIKSLN